MWVLSYSVTSGHGCQSSYQLSPSDQVRVNYQCPHIMHHLSHGNVTVCVMHLSFTAPCPRSCNTCQPMTWEIGNRPVAAWHTHCGDTDTLIIRYLCIPTSRRLPPNAQRCTLAARRHGGMVS